MQDVSYQLLRTASTLECRRRAYLMRRGKRALKGEARRARARLGTHCISHFDIKGKAKRRAELNRTEENGYKRKALSRKRKCANVFDILFVSTCFPQPDANAAAEIF